MGPEGFNFVQIILIGIGLGLLPFLAVTATAFTKISIVLFLVRNAMGLQQVPSNLVIQAISLTLTLFICAPLVERVYDIVSAPDARYTTTAEVTAVARRAREPIVEYLSRYTTEESRQFLVSTTTRIWPEERRLRLASDDLVILLPSFTISELKRAFEIGFLLYLPFLVIDLVVTTILIAMGLSQVQPTIITVPFKIFVFIAVDGWARLIHGLILSYAT
jgi:type III secretion protein R